MRICWRAASETASREGRRWCGCRDGGGGAGCGRRGDLGLGGVAVQSQDGVEVEMSVRSSSSAVGSGRWPWSRWSGPRPPCGRGPRERGLSRPARQIECAGGAGVASVRQTPGCGRCGRGEQSPRFGESGWAITCLSCLVGWSYRRRAEVSVAAASHRSVAGVAGRVGLRVARAVVGSRRGPARRGRSAGRSGGGPGHSAAMIASNSARSRSSSASSRSRNCSSVLRVASTPSGRTCRGHLDHPTVRR